MPNTDTPWNPENGAHRNIVSNFKYEWMLVSGKPFPSNMITDQMVFNSWRDNYSIDTTPSLIEYYATPERIDWLRESGWLEDIQRWDLYILMAIDIYDEELLQLSLEKDMK